MSLFLFSVVLGKASWSEQNLDLIKRLQKSDIVYKFRGLVHIFTTEFFQKSSFPKHIQSSLGSWCFPHPSEGISYPRARVRLRLVLLGDILLKPP